MIRDAGVEACQGAIGKSELVGRADVLDAMGGIGGRAADEHAVGVALLSVPSALRA